MRDDLQSRETSRRLVLSTLAATPVVFFGALFLLFMADGLHDEWIALEQWRRWLWTALGLVVSYHVARAHLRRKDSRERRQTIEVMIRFWSWRDRPEGVPDPMEDAWAREEVEAVLSEWSRGALKVRPGSEYPKTPFELVERVAASHDRLYEKLRAMHSAGTRITLRDHADEGV